MKYTSNASDIQAYLTDIRKYKVLTDAEEHDAFIRYKAGDKKALDLIINSNQRFVFSIAKSFARKDSDILDFVSEGTIGLMQAAENFDPNVGSKFLTFAIYYVRRNISNYILGEHSEVRKSNAGKYTAAVAKIKREFLQTMQREPSTPEIIAELEKRGINVKDTRDLLDLNMKSINDNISEDSSYDESEEFNRASASVNDYERCIEKDDSKTKVVSALNCLDERSKKIVQMSFGIGYDKTYTDSEIAKKFGLTNMRISQLRRAAVAKMKDAVEAFG